MEKPQKITSRQYMGLVHNLNSRMPQMPPLFNNNQQLDESKLMDSPTKKPPRSHKTMMISQGFNSEAGDLAFFVEHYERDETIDNISIAKFSAFDEDSDTMKGKKAFQKD